MRDQFFGLPTKKGDPQLLDRTLRIIKWLHEKEVHRLVNPLDRHYSLMQAYRNEFELIDQRLKVREFGVVSVTDKHRGLAMLMPKARRMREYKIYEVGKYYQISLLEFMQLPRDMIDMILQDLQNDLIITEERRREAERKAKAEEKAYSNQLNNPLIDPRIPGR